MYIRTNATTSEKFQVVSSAGKLTNAILSCLNWMRENATTFVENRTFYVDESTKRRFFDALCDLASYGLECLEFIQLSDFLRQKLLTEGLAYGTELKAMLGYLILIGMSKNEQRVKAVAVNYRRSVGTSQKHNTSGSASVSGAFGQSE